MQKILLICLVLVLIAFNMQLHTGRGGYVDDAKTRGKIIEQTQINKQLEERNQAMMMKIAGLKGSSAALEARARNELNVIKPGEILVSLPIESAAKIVSKK